MAREFLDIKRAEWSVPHAARWIERLQKDVFPWIGSKSLAEVTSPMLLQTLRRVEARGVRETVHSICQSCGQVFRYGVLLRAIDGYQGSLVTRTALRLSALTFQRPGNLRAMQWAALQLEGPATWTIPAVEMKRSRYGKDNGHPHVVPLARQAVSLLREIWPLLATESSCFLACMAKGAA